MEENSITTPEAPLCEFEFNVTIPEEDAAFRLFQKKYVFKRNLLKSIGFGLLAVGFLISAIRYPEEKLNYILLAVCLAAIAVIWINNRQIRRSLMEALKMLEDDRYIFSLFEDRFRIETIIPEEEKNDEEQAPIPPQETLLSDPDLDVSELEDKFVLILKKQTIYVLPKRCMDEETISILRKGFHT